MEFETSEITTKQKILECAANLFAVKGFTETTIRELAVEVGLKNPASLYFHFPSKHAILEHMLDDFTEYNTDVYMRKKTHETLQQNSTIDGIMQCYSTVFPESRMEYYLKVLCVVLQEQLRNPLVRTFTAEHIILSAEANTKSVIGALKDLGIIRQDVDPDFWMKSVSNLFYSFAARRMLGIGDNSPDFEGRGMVDMLKDLFELLLEKHGTTGS